MGPFVVKNPFRLSIARFSPKIFRLKSRCCHRQFFGPMF